MPSDYNKLTELGGVAERLICGAPLAHGCGLMANPAKFENPTAVDACLMIPADVKTVTTPFRTADRYGIEPEHAITLNVKSLNKYQATTPVMAIVFNILIPGREARRVAFLSEIERAIRSGKAQIHNYKTRNDPRHATASYVLDERWFRKF